MAMTYTPEYVQFQFQKVKKRSRMDPSFIHICLTVCL